MVDDSLILENVMEFHPCDTPYGMKDYVLSDLTLKQKSKLHHRKREKIRSDEQYLADHPEIRGLITMILRLLMRIRPMYNIYEVIGQYFTRSSVDLKEEVYSYIDERSKVLSPNSTIIYNKSTVPESILSEIVEEDDFEELLVVDDMEEKGDEERSTGIRWETERTEEEEQQEKEHVTTIETICKEILQQIIEKIFEEEDTVSMGSIASIGFPVDYDDHAYSEDDDDFDDVPYDDDDDDDDDD